MRRKRGRKTRARGPCTERRRARYTPARVLPGTYIGGPTAERACILPTAISPSRAARPISRAARPISRCCGIGREPTDLGAEILLVGHTPLRHRRQSLCRLRSHIRSGFRQSAAPSLPAPRHEPFRGHQGGDTNSTSRTNTHAACLVRLGEEVLDDGRIVWELIKAMLHPLPCAAAPTQPQGVLCALYAIEENGGAASRAASP